MPPPGRGPLQAPGVGRLSHGLLQPTPGQTSRKPNGGPTAKQRPPFARIERTPYMTAAEWSALEADPRVTIAANGSFVPDMHTEGGDQ